MAANKHIINTRFANKSDTSTNWNIASNAAKPFIPLKGEIIFYTDLNRIKIGDGVKTPNQLEFVSSTGDMAKATYDKDGNGIVDNAEKLGGVAASEYAKKTDVPTVPTKVSAFENDKGYLTEHQSLAGLATETHVSTQIGAHNTSDSAHNDIRLLVEGLTSRLNALADTDDTTLDQMSEIVEYIKDNRELIEGVTTNKVNVSDIINNLTTNVTNKPLSAAQGVELKGLIDAIKVPAKLSELADDSTHRLVTDAEKTTWNNKSNFSGNYNDLINTPTIPTVNNGKLTIKQNGTEKGTFTANQSGNVTIELTDTNTQAVTSVAGKTGAVSLSKGDVGLDNVDNTADKDKNVNWAAGASFAQKVTVTESSAASYYPVMFESGGCCYKPANNTVTANPSTGTLKANTFEGTATKATCDGTGRNIADTLDSKSSLKQDYIISAGDGSTHYYKLLTLTPTSSYIDSYYEFDVVARTNKYATIRVFLVTASDQYITSAYVTYDGNMGNAISAYIYKDWTNGVNRLEVWGTVGSWDTWGIFPKTYRYNSELTLTWDCAEGSALPTDATETVTPTPHEAGYAISAGSASTATSANKVTIHNSSAVGVFPIMFANEGYCYTPTSGIGLNPSTGNIVANNFYGALKGTADAATQDASGNIITSTYATKTELTNGLAGKAPSSHTHTKSQITDFPTSMPASDVYSWAKASSKPSYSWSEITSKPSTFTPASHSQAASTITGLATVATSGKYSDLSGKPTIPAAANNGTLTIQKNGTTVATFGANQSTAATANITVPTKTSDLTNDSGFKNISYGTTLPPTGVNGQIFLLQG